MLPGFLLCTRLPHSLYIPNFVWWVNKSLLPLTRSLTMRFSRTRFLLLLTALVLLLTTLAHADSQAGVDAYKRMDYGTVLHEWLPLAEQGDARGQYYFGVLYEEGGDVPQDDTHAQEWLLKAAAQGDKGAQVTLGFLYAMGRGVSQDYALAREWYLKAAAQGVALAQYSLGLLYANGQGVSQDYVQAHMWVNLAAAQGQEEAVAMRDEIAQEMTPEQIAEAQRLAREWKPIRSMVE